MSLRASSIGQVPTREVNLRELLLEVADLLGINAMDAYLFGSRKDQTGSVRSDIDVLLVLNRHLKQEEAKELWDLEPYLDVFVARNGVARSVVNESEISRSSDQELISVLGAAPLFIKGDWQLSANDLARQRLLAERNPAASLLPLYDLYDAVPAERADLLVVTALTEEYSAVLDAFGHEGPTEPSARLPVADNEGQEWLVRVVNMGEMGSVGAALRTRDALLRTKAFHVVLVGICAGVPEKVELDEVVIPKTVIYFESAKIAADGERRSDDSRECDPEVVRRADSYSAALLASGLRLRADGRVMACGEKVVADSEFRQSLEARHRKLTAIDMESYGVLRAAEEAGRRATVIKGVCDMADGSKNDDHHRSAAHAAARVLVQLVQRRAFCAVR